MITQRVQHHGYEAHFEVQRFQFWGGGGQWGPSGRVPMHINQSHVLVCILFLGSVLLPFRR